MTFVPVRATNAVAPKPPPPVKVIRHVCVTLPIVVMPDEYIPLTTPGSVTTAGVVKVPYESTVTKVVCADAGASRISERKNLRIANLQNEFRDSTKLTNPGLGRWLPGGIGGQAL
jgi:hypothetical protein